LLVWLNGAYGAGKTTVARHLAGVIPGAEIIDPEQIGFLIRRMLHLPRGGDFQDEPLWREFTVKILARASLTGKTIIVPMALAELSYFKEIMAGLAEHQVFVRHFALLASPETLQRRLFWRLDFPRSRSWAFSRARECAAALKAPEFAVHVETDERTSSEISLEILGHLHREPREETRWQPSEPHEQRCPDATGTQGKPNELPKFIQVEIARMGEHSYGVNLVTVKLKDGTVITDVYVGWATDVIKVGQDAEIGFHASDVIAVKHQRAPSSHTDT
jgi:energy-coupling factor transporter ATP-binding protein EcfA2